MIYHSPTLKKILTPQQVTILKMICAGKTNHQIAKELGLKEDTIKTHVKNIMSRLKLRRSFHRTRQYLVTIAYEVGIVTPGDVALPYETERLFL